MTRTTWRSAALLTFALGSVAGTTERRCAAQEDGPPEAVLLLALKKRDLAEVLTNLRVLARRPDRAPALLRAIDAEEDVPTRVALLGLWASLAFDPREAAPVLVSKLADADLRSIALGALIDEGPAAGPSLERGLESTSADVRGCCALALSSIGAPISGKGLDGLAGMAKTGRVFERAAIALAARFAGARPPEVGALLVALSKDEAPVVRRAALEAIRESAVGGDDLRARTIALLGDADSGVSGDAAWTLGAIGESRAEVVAALAGALREACRTGDKSLAVICVCRSLVLQGRSGVRIVMDMAADVARLRFGEETLSCSLGELPEDGLPVCVEEMTHGDALRRRIATDAVCALCDRVPSRGTALRGLTHSPDARIRSAAVRCALKASPEDPELLGQVAVGLTSADPAERRAMAEQLPAIDVAKLKAATLDAALADPDERDRVLVAAAVLRARPGDRTAKEQAMSSLRSPDARLRAAAIDAVSSSDLELAAVSTKLTDGLLDRDDLVQQAAKKAFLRRPELARLAVPRLLAAWEDSLHGRGPLMSVIVSAGDEALLSLFSKLPSFDKTFQWSVAFHLGMARHEPTVFESYCLSVLAQTRGSAGDEAKATLSFLHGGWLLETVVQGKCGDEAAGPRTK